MPLSNLDTDPARPIYLASVLRGSNKSAGDLAEMIKAVAGTIVVRRGRVTVEFSADVKTKNEVARVLRKIATVAKGATFIPV